MRIKNIVITAKMPKKYDFAIHFTVLVLLLFGTLMIVSTTVGNASSVLSIIIAFVKQAVFLVVSYTLMVLLANNFTMQKAQKPYMIFVLFASFIHLVVPTSETSAFSSS